METKKDLTIADVGRISCPAMAFNFVKKFHESAGLSSGLVSVILCNKEGLAIGLVHSLSSLDLSWRLATVMDAVREKDCSGVVVVYGRETSDVRPTPVDINAISDLKKRLGAVQKWLTDVILIGKSRYMSFVTERTYSKQ